MTPPPEAGARSDITRALNEASRGNREGFDRLMPLVYEELKRLARGQLRLERSGHTLDTTALVHEAYLKLVEQDRVEWQSRAHFYAVASAAMRRILIDYAKARNAHKRGGGAPHESLDDTLTNAPLTIALAPDQTVDLLVLNDALNRLAVFDARGASVVEYRFFGGMSHTEIAEVLGISEITVRRLWQASKTWLRRAMG